MPYIVLIERNAEKDIKKLPKEVLIKLKPLLIALKENPRPQGCRKIVGSIQDWRIRLGEYRVLYEIVEQRIEVRIMKIKHRKDVYRGV